MVCRNGVRILSPMSAWIDVDGYIHQLWLHVEERMAHFFGNRVTGSRG